jgi:hypothetical protein
MHVHQLTKTTSGLVQRKKLLQAVNGKFFFVSCHSVNAAVRFAIKLFFVIILFEMPLLVSCTCEFSTNICRKYRVLLSIGQCAKYPVNTAILFH